MKTDQIRDSFLNFFGKKGHKIVPSDSLVPQNDPTLLFTGAGMNQFKEYFLGLKKDLKRAASSQKCLRTGDLDEVGKTPYHHSFFEMLGNFSFGDYFKEEAIAWAWEYLTEEVKIPKERLRVSVHQKDEEAFKIWRSKIEIRENWIYRLGDKSNFWPANAPAEGPNGPCGPCSEIYFDQNPQDASEDISSSRFAEIWNLVFTQFNRQDGGKMLPLQNKNIDTGMGLERLACVLQGRKTNFEIDIFQPIHERILKALGMTQPLSSPMSLYAISDHTRAVTFSIADGVIPTNDGRGYVVRKLIRRALWHAHQIAPGKRLQEEAFLFKIVPTIAAVMAEPYPEIQEAQDSIAATLRGEEEKFLDTLETGLQILEKRLANLQNKHSRKIPGEAIFELYDTYGFPDELTCSIAHERGFEIDQEGFNRLMEGQRSRAKEATQIASSIFVTSELEKKLTDLAPTAFLGYQTLEANANVLLADLRDGKGTVVLDQTPFYAESGGQVGDQGSLENKTFQARVTDTQKKDKVIIHAIEIVKGKPREGETVKASVDRNRRERAMRNHTATHLLHAALREVLGKQVRQLGSLVSPEKLRFDYSYAEPLTADQRKKIEDLVNKQILKDLAVSKEEKSIEDARREGAIAFFGEKYGEKVRVVTVPGFSKEFCGGTHCERTGQIGFFILMNDSSIASGTRRIEALTGEGALEHICTLRGQILTVAQSLKVSPAEILDKVSKLQERVKKLEKGQSKLALQNPELLDTPVRKNVGRVTLTVESYKDLNLEVLRKKSDELRSSLSNTVYFLGSATDDKVNYLLGMTPDLKQSGLSMTELSSESINPLLSTSSGGRLDLVQGGAPNKGQLKNKNEQLSGTISLYLEQKLQKN